MINDVHQEFKRKKNFKIGAKQSLNTATSIIFVVKYYFLMIFYLSNLIIEENTENEILHKSFLKKYPKC